MANLIGASLGRYQILELLGEGGMATVYKAYDTRLEREVAIKVIRREAFPPEETELLLKRFERESKMLARLSHPNIVGVIDYGEYEGLPYLVMVYVPGGTLKQRLGTPMPWKEAARLLLPIARALEYVHENNIINRDVKPSNILMTLKGQPMMSDFGLVKLFGEKKGEGGATLTSSGSGIGTPDYMAPEQWMGEATTLSDQYSLGVVLYEMITGHRPYAADTPAGILLKQATEPLPLPKTYVPDLPQNVESVLLKVLAKQPGDRYPDVGAFAGELENLLAGREVSASTVKTEQLRERMTGKAAITPKPPASPTEKTIVARKKRPFPTALVGLGALAALLALAALAVVGGIWWLSAKPGPSPAAATDTQPALPSSAATAFLPTPTSEPLPATGQPTDTPFPTETPVPTEITDSKDVNMRLVPPGTFVMGSDTDNADERPAHDVYLDGFYMDTFEVTNALYRACVNAGVCERPKIATEFAIPQYDNYPVVYVDWDMAKAYCEWREAGLPTEAQWEKAARGTDGRYYPWGVGINCNLANSSGCVGHLTPVGSYPQGVSPYGLFDMAGNVSEWVLDWYLDTYYQISPFENPLGPDTGIYRVIRDGTFEGLDVRLVRTTIRSLYDPTKSADHLGFRCARPAP